MSDTYEAAMPGDDDLPGDGGMTVPRAWDKEAPVPASNEVVAEIQVALGIEQWRIGYVLINIDQDSYPQLARGLREIADDLDKEAARVEGLDGNHG